MKQLAAVSLLAVCLVLAGCGANANNPMNINGGWNATLIGTNNSTIFSFGLSLIVNGDGTLSVTNFQFTSNSPCFVSGESESGSFTLSGDFNGNVTGKFNLIVLSGSPVGNTLTLNGTANGNTISGTWSLTGGTGCTGSGKFTMTRE
ncbi:MAG TPA: hypothetical protein VMG31_00255 [Verrucomicrobiae bacterium]|nr:hypothetical protein [Verrucomicrobiae bacterium]